MAKLSKKQVNANMRKTHGDDWHESTTLRAQRDRILAGNYVPRGKPKRKARPARKAAKKSSGLTWKKSGAVHKATHRGIRYEAWQPYPDLDEDYVLAIIRSDGSRDDRGEEFTTLREAKKEAAKHARVW